MAPPIITPDTFNTPIYHYLVVLKNLADDFANENRTVAPISVVALPSNIPHVSGTGFYDNTTGKSTNPTIAGFLCPSGILTAPASSFGMDYIRLFPGQSSSIVLQGSSILSGLPSGLPNISSIVSSFPTSGLTFRYHILSGIKSENIVIYEERSGARNNNIARNWSLSDFDYFVGSYKQANQKISATQIFGDYYITSGGFGQMISYHFAISNGYLTKNVYLPEYESYQSSATFLTDPTLYYFDVSSENGAPQILPNYTYGNTLMRNRDFQSVVADTYTFGSKNIGVIQPQFINSVKATAYLDGTVYLNPTIPNYVSTTFIVGGGYAIFSGAYASSVVLPDVQYPNRGLSIERSLQQIMHNYLTTLTNSKKLNDTFNDQLSLKRSFYDSIILELLKTTGAKSFIDSIS